MTNYFPITVDGNDDDNYDKDDEVDNEESMITMTKKES